MFADVARLSADSKVARALTGPAGAGGNKGGCGSGHESPPWIADGRVCIHCNNSSKPEREIMGKFAESCKGKTMGAFFLLLLPAGKTLSRLEEDQTAVAVRQGYGRTQFSRNTPAVA